MRRFVFFTLICGVLFSCRNEKKDVEISYYESGNVKEISVLGKTIKSYTIKFDERGVFDSIVQFNPDSTEVNMVFYRNGNLKSYKKSKENIQNSAVIFDSASNISEINIVNFIIDGNYLNQSLVFNSLGIISSQQSFYLLIKEKLLRTGEAEIDIDIIGGHNKKCYAIIGNFDDQYNYLGPKNIDTIFGENNRIKARINVVKGQNRIKGKVIDFDGDIGREIYFTKDIFCL